VAQKFHGRPYGPELLDPREAPVLVQTTVTESDLVDIVTDDGCVDAGLPKEYPNDPAHGGVVDWNRCQPIGAADWASGEFGIACRSATPNAPADGEELAWFAQPRRSLLTAGSVLAFDDWFW
jgi:hypothetical protein